MIRIIHVQYSSWSAVHGVVISVLAIYSEQESREYATL